MTVAELREKLRFFEDHAKVMVLDGNDNLVDTFGCHFSIPPEQADDPARYPTDLVIFSKEGQE